MTVFTFDNYKIYLKNRIHQMPQKGRGEILRLAKALSCHPTLISQALNTDKNFSIEQGINLCSYLGFTDLETEYFLCLLQMERAGSSTAQDYFKKRLAKLKTDSQQLAKRVVRDTDLSEENRARFYSDWLYSAVRIATDIKGYDNIDRLSKLLQISRAQTNGIVDFLLETGLLAQKGDRLAVGVQRTYLEQSSPFVRQHHRNWRLQSMARASRLSDRELMFTCPVSISEKDFSLLREQLTDFIQQFFARVKDSSPEKFACLSIDWFFPISIE